LINISVKIAVKMATNMSEICDPKAPPSQRCGRAYLMKYSKEKCIWPLWSMRNRLSLRKNKN